MDTKTILGLRIKEQRLKKGLTQKELATEIGITRRTMSLYEQGKNKAKGKIIYKLAVYFCVTTDYLLGLVNEPRRIKNTAGSS